MLFKDDILQRIRAGRVTLAFRRWKRPSVQAGGTLRTAIGVLGIDGIGPVQPQDITQEDAERAGYASRDALISELDRRPGGTLVRIAFRWLGEDPREALREAAGIDASEAEQLRRTLSAFDARSRAGGWTVEMLRLIGDRDGTTAAEIAERLGLEKAAVKLKVRKLKELGLTESLRSGYRLSPRGRALLGSMPEP